MSEELTYHDAAWKQALNVLDVMSTASIKLMLEQVKKGRIDGSSYSNTYGDYDGKYRSYYTNRRIARRDFVGCFLGWAGFLEHLSITKLREKITVLPGPFAKNYPERIGTDTIEAYVASIARGDTPQTNPNSRGLHDILVKYLEDREAGRRPQKVEVN